MPAQVRVAFAQDGAGVRVNHDVSIARRRGAASKQHAHKHNQRQGGRQWTHIRKTIDLSQSDHFSVPARDEYCAPFNQY